MKFVLTTILLFTITFCFAQEKLTGTIYDADKRSRITLAFINNITQQEGIHSDKKGEFSLTAEKGDLIVFSFPGFESDTLIVEDFNPKLVLMRPSLILLQEVVIVDSALKRRVADPRKEYAAAYSAATTSIMSRNGEVSLYNMFNKQAKQKREFQKFIGSETNEKLIDQRFNKAVVANITKLNGQVLEDFVSYYRPTYSSLQSMSAEQLRLYIMRSYNAYIKLPAEARIYPPLPKTGFSGR